MHVCIHPTGAEAGTLTFMCGGDAGSVARAERAVLRHMGQRVVHCGKAGTGGVAKICNNLVLGVNMAGVAEAMNLGVRLGACMRGGHYPAGVEWVSHCICIQRTQASTRRCSTAS